MVMIPCFPALLEKNLHSLGNMFDTVNKIIVTGKAYFAENPQKLSTFLEMGKTCMFSEKDTVSTSTGNNAEGAVLFQLILQVFEGTPALGESGIFEFILEATCERIAKAAATNTETKLATTLNKHLLGVFLSASIYAPEITVRFLLRKENYIDQILDELFLQEAEFKHEYEEKLYVVGLSQLMTVGTLWPQKLPQAVLLVLKKLQNIKKVNTEKMRKQGNREINPGQNPESDEEDLDSEELSDDDSDEFNGDPMIDNDSLAAVTGGSKDNMEESKEENLLGFNGIKDEKQDEEALFDFSITLDLISSPLKQLN